MFKSEENKEKELLQEIYKLIYDYATKECKRVIDEQPPCNSQQEGFQSFVEYLKTERGFKFTKFILILIDLEFHISTLTQEKNLNNRIDYMLNAIKGL